MNTRTHPTRSVLTLALAALTVFALMAMPALAGKGGNGNGKGKPAATTSSLDLVMTYDADGDGAPDYGDRITFALSTDETSPFVSVDCYQGDDWVYAASVGYFDAYPWDQEFTLAADSWNGGGADCVAELYTTKTGKRLLVHATLRFQVEG